MTPLQDLLAISSAAEAVWRETQTEEARLAWRRLWDIAITCPGDEGGPGGWVLCTPTVLSREKTEDDLSLDPGYHLYRGACLGCGWVGSPKDDENDAAEDANDHAFPVWRTLPIVPPIPFHEAPAAYEKATTAWLKKVEPLLPPNWIERGGPIRTLRKPPGTRHVPRRTPGGGYDMAVIGEEEPEPGPKRKPPAPRPPEGTLF